MSPLHHRMPLVFESTTSWLEDSTFDGHMDALSWYSVDKAVNNTHNQGASLIIKQ
jgi:putative SOS response-associated peptidase YedK